MEKEKLKKLNEDLRSLYGPLTEEKINLLIKGIRDPKWDKLLEFFQQDDFWDYSYIQSPSHALFIPKVVPNTETGFYLYIHLGAPIFTCFFKKMHFGFSFNNTRYTISSISNEKKFHFNISEVINRVKETYVGYNYLPHQLLFREKVDWGLPMGAMEKEDGYFIFEYFFEVFHFLKGDEIVILD